MARLNLTLDPDTWRALVEHAEVVGRPRAAVARELLRASLQRHESMARRRKLALDYGAGREDARKLLAQWEGGELELLDDEES